MRIQNLHRRIWGRQVGAVDFYCHKAGLVVEVDVDIHDLQQEEDARREKVLGEIGLRTCAATERSVEALSALGMKKWEEI